jgi:hypothetical protein
MLLLQNLDSPVIITLKNSHNRVRPPLSLFYNDRKKMSIGVFIEEKSISHSGRLHGDETNGRRVDTIFDLLAI